VFSFAALENVAKSLLIFVTLLYALGLIVTNQYLMSLGISEFSSLRPKYVVTGTWTFLLLLAGSLPILTPVAFLLRLPEDRKSKLNILGVLCGGLIMGVGLAFNLEGLILEVLRAGLVRATAIICVTSVFTALPIGLWAFARRIPGIRPILSSTLVIAICGSLVALSGLIVDVYQEVPEALGGGKPMIADLVLNSAGVAFWKQTGALFDNNPGSMNAGRVKILYQNDHELVIKAPYKNGQQPKEKVIILNKSLVDGILPAEHEKAKPWL